MWPPRPWTADDVPEPPYFHGSSYRYPIGGLLPTDTVREDDPDGDDLRRMCFAATSVEAALDWACRRNLSNEERDTLFVYEVEMTDPEVDTNIHRRGSSEQITSVMAPRGRIVRLELELATADCENDLGKGFCHACNRPSA